MTHPWLEALTEEVAELERQAAENPKQFFGGDGNQRIRELMKALAPIKPRLDRLLRI